MIEKPTIKKTVQKRNLKIKNDKIKMSNFSVVEFVKSPTGEVQVPLFSGTILECKAFMELSLKNIIIN